MVDQQAASATRVCGNLWVGATPPCGARVARFTHIVLCAEELQPPDSCFPGVNVLRVLLDDSGLPMTNYEREAAASMAAQVARLLREGAVVLCACVQGRNRSGLVAALTLQEWGLPADAAIATVKAARDKPGRPAMVNRDFNEFLYMRDMQPGVASS